mmetsp:Transcript_77557/g.147513  ORF Transcript_77557/g.147513 Transcript_77557/m.147513 type:complete len:94 (+) Transcript_77557:99-380(+)
MMNVSCSFMLCYYGYVSSECKAWLRRMGMNYIVVVLVLAFILITPLDKLCTTATPAFDISRFIDVTFLRVVRKPILAAHFVRKPILVHHDLCN